MDLSNLTPAEGSVKSKGKRVGRGQGSGRGGTSARGHKGAKSRSGYSKKVGFEGGQMPLQRRVPKFGFTNINRKDFKGINLDTIQTLVSAKNVETIDLDVLIENGLANRNTLVKILGRGIVDSKVTVKAHSFSKSAKEAIEAKGGSTETIA